MCEYIWQRTQTGGTHWWLRIGPDPMILCELEKSNWWVGVWLPYTMTFLLGQSDDRNLKDRDRTKAQRSPEAGEPHISIFSLPISHTRDQPPHWDLFSTWPCSDIKAHLWSQPSATLPDTTSKPLQRTQHRTYWSWGSINTQRVTKEQKEHDLESLFIKKKKKGRTWIQHAIWQTWALISKRRQVN